MLNDSYKDWLQSLKPGDFVIASGRHDHLRTVARITPTTIILNNETKFRRKDGKQIGADVWYPVWLDQPTDERVHAIKLAKLRQFLQSQNWRLCSDTVVERVYDLVTANEAARKEQEGL